MPINHHTRLQGIINGRHSLHIWQYSFRTCIVSADLSDSSYLGMVYWFSPCAGELCVVMELLRSKASSFPVFIQGFMSLFSSLFLCAQCPILPKRTLKAGLFFAQPHASRALKWLYAQVQHKQPSGASIKSPHGMIEWGFFNTVPKAPQVCARQGLLCVGSLSCREAAVRLRTQRSSHISCGTL